MAKMYVTRRAVFTHAEVKCVNVHTDEILSLDAKLMGFYATCNDFLDAIAKEYRDNAEVKPIAVLSLSYTVETMGQPVAVWLANCEHIKSEPIDAPDAAMFGKRVTESDD